MVKLIDLNLLERIILVICGLVIFIAGVLGAWQLKPSKYPLSKKERNKRSLIYGFSVILIGVVSYPVVVIVMYTDCPTFMWVFSIGPLITLAVIGGYIAINNIWLYDRTILKYYPPRRG